MSASAFRNALERADVTYLRAYWATHAPHLPQPETDEQAEIIMHRARTEAASLSLKSRAWSHRWLAERSLPSGLPDALRPRAERMYPIIAEAVGISVATRSTIFQPAADEIRRSMEDAVEECWADGRRETPFVRQRMGEARDRTIKALFGR